MVLRKLLEPSVRNCKTKYDARSSKSLLMGIRKYGSVDQQLRALTVLDGLIENAGPQFQRTFADEPLLERLRVCATDSLTDPEVKKKCQILFRQWAASYHTTAGMERIVALQKQLPKRKKQVTQAQSRVIQETEREANEDPFGNEDDNTGSTTGHAMGSLGSPSRNSFSSPSTAGSTLQSMPKASKSSKPEKLKNKHKHKAFNLEKEKPQLLQTIASSSVASTNLMNALKLLNRENIRVSQHAETINRFETCKALRRQVLRYIQHVESEQWLGSLINANDSLVDALMAFEILDKSVDDDSDSEDNEWDDSDERSTEEALSGLKITKSPPKPHPALLLNGKGTVRHDDEGSDSDEEDGDDPFADSNAVHTPKAERPGMTW